MESEIDESLSSTNLGEIDGVIAKEDEVDLHMAEGMHTPLRPLFAPQTALHSPEKSQGPNSLLEDIDLDTSNKETSPLQAPLVDAPPPAPFVPSLGAWTKPLKFVEPATPPTPSTPRDYDPKIVGAQLEAFWPTLTDGLCQQKKRQFEGTIPLLKLPVSKLPPPELKGDGTLRFPWAARMNPSSRNLYRAAQPTYRLDGTPEVIIPSKVIQLGPENKEEYIIGQFHRCIAPPGGLVHAVLNRLWGRSCRISIRNVGQSSILIHIPHKETRQWVMQRGVWHVDDCLLFVAPWTAQGTLNIPEISTIPVWVNLKNVPGCCYSRLGLSHVASGLGEPMLTHKPRLDPLSLGEAKVLVEVELDKPFPKKIALDDKLGNIYLVDVEYTWIPTTCEKCGSLGHKGKRCLLSVNTDSVPSNEDKKGTKGMKEKNKDVGAESKGDNTNQGDIKHTVEDSVSSIARDEETQLTEQGVFVADQQMDVEGQSAHTKEKEVAIEEASTQFTLLQQVPLATNASFSTTFQPLAGVQLAQTQPQHIMEEIPSQIIISKGTTSLEDDQLAAILQDNNFKPIASEQRTPSLCTEPEDEVGVETDLVFSLGSSRGGRLLKPTHKYQESEWVVARGRGNRGRRGRGGGSHR